MPPRCGCEADVLVEEVEVVDVAVCVGLAVIVVVAVDVTVVVLVEPEQLISIEALKTRITNIRASFFKMTSFVCSFEFLIIPHYKVHDYQQKNNKKVFQMSRGRFFNSLGPRA